MNTLAPGAHVRVVDADGYVGDVVGRVGTVTYHSPLSNLVQIALPSGGSLVFSRAALEVLPRPEVAL